MGRNCAALQQPLVGEVAEAHELFFIPGRRVFGIDDDVAVVGRVGGIVDPAVACGDLVVGIGHARRGFGGVAEEHADAEQSGGGAAVFFTLGGDAALAMGHGEHAIAPGEAVFPEQNGDGGGQRGLPRCVGGAALEEHEASLLGIPSVGDGDDELPGGGGDAGGALSPGGDGPREGKRAEGGEGPAGAGFRHG